MNIKKFKLLIKEAVSDALNEELPILINEALTRYERKKHINESQFSTDEELNGKLPTEVRNQITDKMGDLFGLKNPKINEVKEEIPGVDKNNPFLKMMVETKQNLTAQDIAGLKNLG